MSAEQQTATAKPNREAPAVNKLQRVARWTAAVLMEYTAVLRVREMRRRALVVFFCWFASALVYYGISLNATNIRLRSYILSKQRFFYCKRALPNPKRGFLLNVYSFPWVTYMQMDKKIDSKEGSFDS